MNFEPTKPIKLTIKNCTAIGQKVDPRQYASIPIMRKSISIGLVINLGKKPHQPIRAHPY